MIVAKEEARAGEVEALISDLRFVSGVSGISRKLERYAHGLNGVAVQPEFLGAAVR